MNRSKDWIYTSFEHLPACKLVLENFRDMNWITPQIAIGNYIEAQNIQLLREERIQSILSLISGLEGIAPSTFGVKEIAAVPLLDGPACDMSSFRRAVDTLGNLVSQLPPVLVHCRAGRSRSPVVVAGYLIKAFQMTPDEALRFVASKRDVTITSGTEDLLWYL